VTSLNSTSLSFRRGRGTEAPLQNGQKQAPGEPIAIAFGGANYALLLRRKGSSRTSTGLLLQWGELVGSARIRLRPREAYTPDGVTLAQFRGNGVHAAVLGYMLGELKRKGFRVAYTLLPADGVAAGKPSMACSYRAVAMTRQSRGVRGGLHRQNFRS